ncbi:hypothetical protein TNCV_4292771 [Trichonephila clavipes]|uniref:Uncharacterized protein n=1 Tax=Trichonephila clavipes TaxID=2585209 RepID=A0A8X6V403_TRICX|nr:hypothetical protein TNCV_4292771 [Trichonephila clavipes]
MVSLLSYVVVIANVTCLTVSDRGPRYSSWQRDRCTSVDSRSFEPHTGDSTIWFGSTSILRENTLEMSGTSTSLPPPLTTRKDLRLDGYLEYSYIAKTLHIYKHPYLLRDSNPGFMAPVLSVANHDIGWAATFAGRIIFKVSEHVRSTF